MTNEFNRRLCEAVWQGNLDEVRQMIPLGADVDCYEESGNTPLHLAAEQNFFEIARVLLEAGALVDKLDRIGEWTPLVHAVEAISDGAIQCRYVPNNAMIRLLLDHGANVSQKTSRGKTALSYARALLNREAEAMLMAAGATE